MVPEKRILVWGGTGFIGQEFCIGLERKGFELTVVAGRNGCVVVCAKRC